MISLLSDMPVTGPTALECCDCIECLLTAAVRRFGSKYDLIDPKCHVLTDEQLVIVEQGSTRVAYTFDELT